MHRAVKSAAAISGHRCKGNIAVEANALTVLNMHQVIPVIDRNGSTDLFRVSPEIVLSRLNGFLRFFGALHACDIKFSGTISHGSFKLEQSFHAISAIRHSKDMSRLPDAFWDKLAAALLDDRNECFIHRCQADIRKLNVIKLHATDFLQLFFHTSAAFNSIFENFFDVFFGIVPIRVEKLNKAGDHFAYCNGITLIQASAEAEVLIKRIRLRHLTHLAHKLCEIIRDETIVIRKEFWSHFRNFPPGNIAVHPVKESTVDHGFREGLEQMGGLQQVVYALVNITHKDHGCIRLDRFFSTCKCCNTRRKSFYPGRVMRSVCINTVSDTFHSTGPYKFGKCFHDIF